MLDDEDVWTLRRPWPTSRPCATPLEAAGIEMQSAELAMVPQNLVAVSADMGQKVLRLMEALDDNDDVQNVYANVDFRTICPPTDLPVLCLALCRASFFIPVMDQKSPLPA